MRLVSLSESEGDVGGGGTHRRKTIMVDPCTSTTIALPRSTSTLNSDANSNQSGERCRNVLNFVTSPGVIVVAVFLLVLAVVLISLVFTFQCEQSYCEERKTLEQQTYAELSTDLKAKAMEQDEIYRSNKLEWVSAVPVREDTFNPAGETLIGPDKTLLFVARTSEKNGMLIGNYFWADSKMAFGCSGSIFYRGSEDIEVLSYPKGTLSWILKNEGKELPAESTLVYGGRAPITGQKTYVCRLEWYGHLLIGTMTDNGICCVSVQGKKYVTEIFEILVINSMGKRLGNNS